jgi:hypothetical protein
LLLAVAGDTDGGVRAHAADALWLQPRDGRWEAMFVDLLDHDDAAVRCTAAMALTGRYGEDVLAALHRRLARERTPTVRRALEAVREQEAHARGVGEGPTLP